MQETQEENPIEDTHPERHTSHTIQWKLFQKLEMNGFTSVKMITDMLDMVDVQELAMSIKGETNVETEKNYIDFKRKIVKIKKRANTLFGAIKGTEADWAEAEQKINKVCRIVENIVHGKQKTAGKDIKIITSTVEGLKRMVHSLM